jgi:hypothetical protein
MDIFSLRKIPELLMCWVVALGISLPIMNEKFISKYISLRV